MHNESKNEKDSVRHRKPPGMTIKHQQQSPAFFQMGIFTVK